MVKRNRDDLSVPPAESSSVGKAQSTLTVNDATRDKRIS